MIQLKLLISKLKLKVIVLQLQIRKALLKQKLTIPNLKPRKLVIVHHGGGSFNFWQVNNHHKNLWKMKSSLGYYIGYQKWIEYDGKLYTARRDNEEGAHTVGVIPHYYNRNSVGICLRGDYDTLPVSPIQILTLIRILDEYKKKGYEIKCHRDFSKTTCPGRYLYNWVKANYG